MTSDEIVEEYIKRIDESCAKAFVRQSNLDAGDFTNPDCKTHWRGVESMNQPEYLHLLNNLCSYPDVVHMHIGFWKGGSLFPCLEGHPDTKVYGVDSFFDKIDPSLYETFQEHSSRLGYDGKYELFDCKYTDLDLSLITDKINFHLYDADHAEEHQFWGLVRFEPVLSDVFIFLVDGYNEKLIYDGTWRALNLPQWEVCYKKELWGHEHGEWHTGHALFVLRKTDVIK